MSTIRAFVYSGGPKAAGVRNRNRLRIGAMAATQSPTGPINVGTSRWCRKRDPEYNRERCMNIAVSRAEKASCQKPAVSLRKHLLPFIVRAQKFYKTTEMSVRTMEGLNKIDITADDIAAETVRINAKIAERLAKKEAQAAAVAAE